MAIGRSLLDVVGGPGEVAGKRFCEIGPGDCRATQVLLAYLGAAVVDVSEPKPRPPAADDDEVLSAPVADGLLPPEIAESERISGAAPSVLQSTVTWRSYAESLHVQDRWDVVFSYAALEYAEDPRGFMRGCWRGLRPGGRMYHLVDLSGHGAFKGPVPPLDSQTYSFWLWRLMYAVGERVTRRHAREYVAAARAGRFDAVGLRMDRVASPEYTETHTPRRYLLVPNELAPNGTDPRGSLRNSVTALHSGSCRPVRSRRATAVPRVASVRVTAVRQTGAVGRSRRAPCVTSRT